MSKQFTAQQSIADSAKTTSRQEKGVSIETQKMMLTDYCHERGFSIYETYENHTYTYGNTSWADLLTAFDGYGIAYEGQTYNSSTGTVSGTAKSGNPICYYNGTRWYFTWTDGRRLASADNENAHIVYTYDLNGIRTSKTVNGVKHTYYYAGGMLLRETYGSNVLDFAYTASGAPFSITYNGTTYYYITNLQGDVMYLVNATGIRVAAYTYDPYGKVLTATGTMATVNPLRYRGYYYDTETGFYYLKSRYYDSDICRFINADGYVSAGQGLLGNNMFVYCLNNPTNYVDREGTNADVLQWWTAGMGWLPFADTVLPVGDIIYIGGILILGAIEYASDQDSAPEISYDEGDVVNSPPSPNDDDDDDDDDYYDDDSNFGGRNKVGKPKGKAPGNNQVQNKQFRNATKGMLNKDQQRRLHDDITGEGFGFHDIVEAAKNLWIFFVALFDKDNQSTP